MKKENRLNKFKKKLACGTSAFIKNKRGSIIEYMLLVAVVLSIGSTSKEYLVKIVPAAITALTSSISKMGITVA